MSDVETEVQAPSVQDLIQAALDQNYNHANDIFGNLMGEKMSDALEQEKIAVANQIYNGGEPEDDDYETGEEVEQQDDADIEDDEELDLDVNDEDLEVDEDEE
jgi:hypothetical protein